MSQLRKSKEIWSGKDEEVGLGIAKSKVKTMTDERATMLEEQAMLKQREDAMTEADGRAADGAERKRKREEADMLRLRKKCVAPPPRGYSAPSSQLHGAAAISPALVSRALACTLLCVALPCFARHFL